jgi:hypothetical protein
MSDQIFEEMDHDLGSVYEGITRQDYAELGMLSVPRIKEHLQKLRQRFSGTRIDEQGHESILQSVSRQLDELEEYCHNFHLNKPGITRKTALQIHALVRKQFDALKQLNERSK